MKPSSRTLSQRIQSSDDSDDQTPNNETPRSPPKLRDTTSFFDEEKPRLLDTIPPKKTVLIEIQEKNPARGRDSVHALSHGQPRIPVTTNPNTIPDDKLVSSTTLFTERLVDTRQLQHTSGSERKSATLGRVKRLQERAGGMVDMTERMQERCLGMRDGKQAYRGGESKSLLDRDHGVGEKKPPVLEVYAKRDGVWKVSDRSFCENGCEALLRAIKNNDKLVELDLSGCNIYRGDDLAQIVRSATSLKRLSLEWNSLGLARTGISALSSAISSNRSLKQVDLRSNRIGPSTAAALAHALQCNYSLTCLDLRWNEIGPRGAAALVTMLQRNHCLTEVRLVGNGIPPSMQAQIDELLEKNRRGKLVTPAAAGPPLLEDHLFPESEHVGLTSRFTPKEMSGVNLERIASLQKEIASLRQEMEACSVELHDVQSQKVATDTQLETVRVELKEENLLRKFVEKETGDLKSQIHLSKQRIGDLEDKLKRKDETTAMKSAALNSELMEAREKGHQAHLAEAEARKENKRLKDQMERIQAESKARMETTQERAKTDVGYKTSVIKRLEAEIAEQNLKHKDELDSLRTKLTAQINNLQLAQGKAIQETEMHKCAARQCETQLVTQEQCFQNEKVASQKVFDGKLNSMKAELVTLKNQLDESNREQQKVKKKHASSVQEYEHRAAYLTSSIAKVQAAKSELDEEMVVMTNEQVWIVGTPATIGPPSFLATNSPSSKIPQATVYNHHVMIEWLRTIAVSATGPAQNTGRSL